MICATIAIDRLRLYAHHGVLAQERAVGNEFEVSLRVTLPADDAAIADDLDGTVNYAEAVDIIKQQMALPSALLEHVAWRIAFAVTARWPQIQSGEVTVAKLAPPIPNTSLARVAVTIPF